MLPKYIILGSDYIGYELHKGLKEYISIEYPSIELIDINIKSPSNLYPEIAQRMGSVCSNLVYTFKYQCTLNDINDIIGIAISSSDIGMTIACNKFPFMRCAKIDSTDNAKFAKTHCNCNFISFGSKNIKLENACDIFKTFLESPNQSECKCDDCKTDGLYTTINTLMDDIDREVYGNICSPT